MGGAIHFLPDETIAIQVGDHLNNSIVQNNNTPLGKVLRVNKDGTPATSNPFYNPADTNPPGGNNWNGDAPGDTDWIDYVWASGLRNPFSGDVDPDTGRYFVGDVGEGTWEEVNDATNPARNFGWPTTEGSFQPGDVSELYQPVSCLLARRRPVCHHWRGVLQPGDRCLPGPISRPIFLLGILRRDDPRHRSE